MEQDKLLASSQTTPDTGIQIQPAAPGHIAPPSPHGIGSADGGTDTLAPASTADNKKQLGRPLPPTRKGKKARKKRGIWGWLILLVVLLVAGGAGYYYWQSNQGPTAFAGTATPVSGRVPVSLSVSASGQIAAKADLALTFGSTGTVTNIYFHQGQSVKKGDKLAAIDDSSLQTTVTTSKAQLSSAQAALNKAKLGATDAQVQQQLDTVKQAELKYQETANGNALAGDIENAKAQLASAQQKLAQDQAGGTDAQKAQAGSSISSAQASLQSAQAKLNQDQQGGTPAQRAQAASAITSAQAGLQSAQAKLNQDQQGGTPAQKAQAQAAISSAQSALDSAQAKYQLTLAGPDAATLSAAQATVDQAQTSLAKTSSQLTAAVQSASTARQTAETALNVAQDQYNTAHSNYYNADGTVKTFTRDSDATAAQNALTTATRNLHDAQAKYDQANSSYNDAQTQLTVGLQAAQSTLNNAKIQLQKVQAGSDPATISSAKSAVDQAQSGLQSAQATLAALSPTAAQIASDQAAIAQSEAGIQSAQASQAALAATGSQIASDQAAITQAQASIQSASAGQAALAPTAAQLAADQASIASAQANLDKLLHPATPNDVAISQAALDSAKAALADLQAGPKPDDIAVSQAQADIAKANYDTAVLNLRNAIISAPFDGSITNDFNIQAGQVIAASTSIFQLVDASALHVDVNVGETDVNKIHLNDPVAVNFDALTGKSFTGKVTFISSKATVTNNVVIYVVTVTLDPIGGGGNPLDPTNNSILQKYPALVAVLGNQGRGQGQGQGQGAGAANGTAGATTGGAAQANTTPGAGGLPAGGAAGGFPGGAAGGQAARAAFGGGTGGVSLCGWTPGRLTAQDTPKIGMSANVTVCLDLQVPADGKVAIASRAIKTRTVQATVTAANGTTTTRPQQVKYVTILEDKATNKTKDVQVETGLVGDTFTIITNGDIKEGDQVVLSAGGTTTRATGANGAGGGGFPVQGGGGGRGG